MKQKNKIEQFQLFKTRYESGAYTLLDAENSGFSPSDIYCFDEGLPGFESLHYFLVAELLDYPPFNLLQSMEEPLINFLMLNVKLLPEAVHNTVPLLEKLKKVRTLDQNTEVLTILKISNQNQSITANLQSPVVLDVETRQGTQIILDSKELDMQYKLSPVTSK